MKYLLLLLVAGLGYGGYSFWSRLQPLVEQVRTQVAIATGKQVKQAPQDPLHIPGQPPAPGAPAAAVAAAPVQPVNRVAESQRLAVAKYPALAVANSEMNSRFVFRYKNLVKEKSPRLQDPAWPLQLADECAAAMADSGKKPAAPRQKGSLASAGSTATR